MVMNFNNFNIIYKFCYIFDLSSALACRVESIQVEMQLIQIRTTNEPTIAPH